ncbi:MAG: [FeFe] hydrogenase H-cluster radical SAM maturase HydE [Pleomorphochaeta sp.]
MLDYNNPTVAREQLLQCNNSSLATIIEYYFTQANINEIEKLYTLSRYFRNKYYSNKVYFRGLIEISSYCKQDCYYCGIRKSNKKANRYRLDKGTILECCEKGNKLGFKTFVLQGGEDPFFTKDIMSDICSSIKKQFPKSALTLSIGELDYDFYKKLKENGVDRFLLRHETATKSHYEKLHPPFMSFDNRQNCLKILKELKYQTGAGFMIDSPFQNIETIANDLIFLKNLNPEMIGMGPFLPHKDTPFKNFKILNINHTLILLALVRILVPKALIPATTALATVDKKYSDLALINSANVIMPNLSPPNHRKDYSLYNNKKSWGNESAQQISNITKNLNNLNLCADFSRGDYFDLQ